MARYPRKRSASGIYHVMLKGIDGRDIFLENYDKIKFYGTFVLSVLYILFMNIIHFLPASIIFIFLFNILYCGNNEIKICISNIKNGTKQKNSTLKSLLSSLVISVLFSTTIWFIFGQVLKTTLP